MIAKMSPASAQRQLPNSSLPVQADAPFTVLPLQRRKHSRGGDEGDDGHAAMFAPLGGGPSARTSKRNSGESDKGGHSAVDNSGDWLNPLLPAAVDIELASANMSSAVEGQPVRSPQHLLPSMVGHGSLGAGALTPAASSCGDGSSRSQMRVSFLASGMEPAPRDRRWSSPLGHREAPPELY